MPRRTTTVVEHLAPAGAVALGTVRHGVVLRQLRTRVAARLAGAQEQVVGRPDGAEAAMGPELPTEVQRLMVVRLLMAARLHTAATTDQVPRTGALDLAAGHLLGALALLRHRSRTLRQHLLPMRRLPRRPIPPRRLEVMVIVLLLRGRRRWMPRRRAITLLLRLVTTTLRLLRHPRLELGAVMRTLDTIKCVR